MAQHLARALIATLLRKGLLTEADVIEMAKGLRDRDLEASAHSAMLAIAEAAAPSVSEFEAQQRRRHIRLIDGGDPDGGNVEQ